MVKGELEVRLRLLRFCIRMQPYHWYVHLRYTLLRSWMCNHTKDTYTFREFVIYDNDQWYPSSSIGAGGYKVKGEPEVRLRLPRSYYDTFVRNTFGSYLQVMREVTFSPVMSVWLIHRDSSPVEYNAGSPTTTSPAKSCSSLLWVWSQRIPDGSPLLVSGQTVERTVRRTS